MTKPVQNSKAAEGENDGRIARLKPAAGPKKQGKKDQWQYRVSVDPKGALLIEVSAKRG